ncbi:MAG: DUF2617 family protein [Phycisphaerae bacterium]
MSIEQKQSVSRLRFRLYDRPLHPELFDIYYDRRVVRKGYEAQLWITGCTHVVGFYRPDHSLVEVTTDALAELPERGLLVEMPFRGEKAHECSQPEGIHYQVNLQVEKMSPRVYSKTHHDLARLGARRGLFVPFPAWMSKSLTPFSYIHFDARPSEFHVYTFHAFPDDLTLVKTQSIFELG